MKDLVFKISVDETNLILEGLGLLPFARVYALVEKIQKQASEQLKAGVQADAAAGLSAAHMGIGAKEIPNG